jgi:hypothetical protein
MPPSFFSERKSHYVAQVGLELIILLPQPPKSWDYSYALQCLVCK